MTSSRGFPDRNTPNYLISKFREACGSDNLWCRDKIIRAHASSSLQCSLAGISKTESDSNRTACAVLFLPNPVCGSQDQQMVTVASWPWEYCLACCLRKHLRPRLCALPLFNDHIRLTLMTQGSVHTHVGVIHII